MRTHYVLVPGLHSDGFFKAVKAAMLPNDEAWYGSCCTIADISINTTRSGDICVSPMIASDMDRAEQ